MDNLILFYCLVLPSGSWNQYFIYTFYSWYPVWFSSSWEKLSTPALHITSPSKHLKIIILKQEVEGAIFLLAWPHIKMRKYWKITLSPSHGNRWRSNHSYHSWKFFQTSCKGIVWSNVVVSGCLFTVGRDVTIPGRTWTGKGVQVCTDIQSSVMWSHILTSDFTRYLSRSNGALMLKEAILLFTPYCHLHGATHSLVSSLELVWYFAEMFCSVEF